MASPFSDYQAVVRHLESKLLVADLKDILKDLNLSSSGNKRPLIDRVTNQLSLLRASNDVPRYNTLKSKILRCGSSPNVLPNRVVLAPRQPTYTAQGSSPSYGQALGMPYQHFAGSARPSTFNNVQTLLNFQPSPFYEVVDRLSNIATLPYSSRNHVSLSFMLSTSVLDLLNGQGSAYKVAVVCADTTNPHAKHLRLEFPSPIDVLVNSQRVQANLKGMKNKPGTVPPADITRHVDRTPRMANRADITYQSGTDQHKKFGLQVVLLKTHSVDELVQKIKAGNHFSKDSVLQKLRKPEDDDIEMASFDLTLKDPLSYMRISVPCRTTFCKHNQCWDAMAFLSINEQTPQWTCPICHIAISGLGAIAVDGYFQDILENVAADVDTILVDPKGNWKVPGDDHAATVTRAKPKDTPESAPEVLDLEDTEDEKDTRAVSAVPKHLHNNTASRSSTPQVNSAKRKASPICIDLTEESDDEGAPPKRVKHSESMDGHFVLPLKPTAAQSVPVGPPSSAHAIRSSYSSQLDPHAPSPSERPRTDYQRLLNAWRPPNLGQHSPMYPVDSHEPQPTNRPTFRPRSPGSLFLPQTLLPHNSLNGDVIGSNQRLWSDSAPSNTREPEIPSRLPANGAQFGTTIEANHSELADGNDQLNSHESGTGEDPSTTTTPEPNLGASEPSAPSRARVDTSPPIVGPHSRAQQKSSPPRIYSDDFSDGEDF